MKRPHRLTLSSDEAQAIVSALRREAIRVEVDECYSLRANAEAATLRTLANRALRV
jgi:hypothetical protein